MAILRIHAKASRRNAAREQDIDLQQSSKGVLLPRLRQLAKITIHKKLFVLRRASRNQRKSNSTDSDAALCKHGLAVSDVHMLAKPLDQLDIALIVHDFRRITARLSR
ncbi:hypothetical protein WJ62_03000 [Burkholderia diffusa]|nr:hypothetical protein WJ62_03000 [Burkholderia diffusa]